MDLKESFKNIISTLPSSSSQQVTGRTWLDLLTVGRYRIFLILLMLGLIILVLIKPDIFTGVISGIQDNSHYFLAIAIGFVLGRYVVQNYLNDSVYLGCFNTDTNFMELWAVSKPTFSRIISKNKISTFSVNSASGNYYPVKSVDPVTKEIVFGDCNSSGKLPEVVMARENNYNMVIHENVELTRKVALFEDTLELQSTNKSRKTMRRYVSIEDSILSGNSLTDSEIQDMVFSDSDKKEGESVD